MSFTGFILTQDINVAPGGSGGATPIIDGHQRAPGLSLDCRFCRS